MQDYYGETRLIQIDDDEDFWYLINSMQEDNSDYMQIVNLISEQYKMRNLFGLRMQETSEMYLRNAKDHPLFCRTCYGVASDYLMPCFYSKIKNKIEICWVQSKARRLG